MQNYAPQNYITSNASLIHAGYHLINKSVFERQEGDVIEKDIKMVSRFIFEGKPYQVIEMKASDLPDTNESLQRLYWYLLIQLANQHFEPHIVMDLNHYFKTIGAKRLSKNIKILLRDLDVLSRMRFTYRGKIYKQKEPEILKAPNSVFLTYLKRETPKGQLKEIEIFFGSWCKIAKEIEANQSIEINPSFLAIDHRKYPFSKTYYMKMRERWRYNREKRKDNEKETISLKKLLETTGEYQDVFNQAKKRGLMGERGIINRIEQRLDQLEKYGVVWEWSFLPKKVEDIEKVKIIYSMSYDDKESV